jgi:hypothetical protein
MAQNCKPSQGTVTQAHAASGDADSQVEFIAADKFKAHLAANGDVNSDDDDANNFQADADEVTPKEKKKKKKSKAKRPKPTGFEEYHADAPLTPDEYAEEQQLYDRYFWPSAMGAFLAMFADIYGPLRSIPFAKSVHLDLNQNFLRTKR